MRKEAFYRFIGKLRIKALKMNTNSGFIFLIGYESLDKTDPDPSDKFLMKSKNMSFWIKD